MISKTRLIGFKIVGVCNQPQGQSGMFVYDFIPIGTKGPRILEAIVILFFIQSQDALGSCIESYQILWGKSNIATQTNFCIQKG